MKILRKITVLIFILSITCTALIVEVVECMDKIEKLEYRIQADTVEIEGYRKNIEFKEDVIQGLINRINSDL